MQVKPMFTGMLAALVAGAALGAPAGRDAPIVLSASQQASIGIETAALDAPPGPGTGRLTFGGRVEFAERGPASIIAPTAAQVTAVYAHPGERVRRGEPVLSLTGPDVINARLTLESAAAAAAAARQRLDRDTRLYSSGAIARSRLEATQSQERSAAATLAAARAVLGGGDFDASGTLRMRATAAGLVMGPALAPGDAVRMGQVLGYVAESPAIHVALAVPVAIARTLHPGDAVFISTPGCEATGRLHAIGGDIDTDTQAAAVHVSIDEPSCLAPGETVSARLAARPAAHDGFAVPAAAFVTVGNRAYVFLAGPAGFEPVEVDVTGMRAGYAVGKGLAPGRRVVIRGAAVLKAEWQKRSAD